MDDNILTTSKCVHTGHSYKCPIKLKQSKCSVVHVDKGRSTFHIEQMHKDNSAVYLGNTFQKSGRKQKPNIMKGVSRYIQSWQR